MADVIYTDDKTKILSGNPLNFYTPRRQRIRSLKVYFSPKQEGEGTPNPDNIRPINGWTGIEVGHCGKNLLIRDDPANPTANYFHSSTGTTKYSTTEMAFYSDGAGVAYPAHALRSGTSSMLFIAPKDMTITFSVDYKNVGTTYGLRLLINGTRVTDIHGSPDGIWHKYKYTVTLNKDDGIHLICYASIYWRNLQIELGSTATEYTPHKTTLSLPNEYQEVEYLESTGTQYIATNYVSGENVRVEWSMAQTVAPSGDNMFFGWTNGTNSVYAEWYNYSNHFYGASNIGRYKSMDGWKTSLNNRFDASMDNETLTINNITKTKTEVYTSFKTILPMYIFAWNNNNSAQYINKGMRLYYLKFYEDNVLVANFIPCYRKSDKVPGMYDTVTKTFYTNSGTGEFITGPAVNRYDIDWSEDVGTVYGGYVDLVSGELVEEWVAVHAADYSWYNYSANTIFYHSNAERTAESLDISDKLQSHYGYHWTAAPNNSIISGNKASLFIKHEGVTSRTEFMAWLAEVDPIICYKLATPITHQLSPATLSTLMFDNNFWSNADRIEIEYDYIGVFDALESRKNIMSNTPHLETTSGNVVSFSTDMAANLKECKIYFKPKQEGTGDPSPDNVRPITGWNGVTVTRCGKNLINPNAFSRVDGYTINYNGVPTPESTPKNGYSDNYYRVKPNTTYTLLGSGTRVPIEYDINKNFVYRKGGQDPPQSWVTNNDTAYIRIQYNMANLDVSTLQLVEGVTAQTGYIQSDFNYFPISWTQQGTIYGGYVDLVNGELVEEWLYDDMGNYNWNGASEADSSYCRSALYPNTYGGDSITIPYLLTDKLKVVTHGEFNSSIGINGHFCTINKSGRFYFMTPDIHEMTSTQVKEYLTGKKFAVKVETPIVYQLTSTQIKTLKSINNIYSDTSGNIEVKFWKH